MILSDQCTFHYKLSEYYDAENEKDLEMGPIPPPPQANIHWPINNPILSEKDSKTAYLS